MKNQLIKSILIISIVSLISCDSNEENNISKTETAEINIDDSTNPEKEVKTNELQTDFFVIDNTGTGAFKVGQNLPTASQTVHLTLTHNFKTLSAEGEEWEEYYYEVAQDNINLLTCTVEEYHDANGHETIGELKLHNEQFKTSNGIGINSTLEEFIEQYSDYRITYSYVNDKFIVQNKTMNQVQFILDPNDYIANNNEYLTSSDIVPLKKSDFNDLTRIKSIRIFHIY